MTDLIARIREIADRRARYLRTRQELRALPLDVALDLDIYPGDADRIARSAVYGDARKSLP
ncbi:MAG: hypothetical protein V2I65_03315 [Paracoccaceae bacterium]|jgi:hypothetical protein|nr:hypothetical protein [Paracoccaceae bacterium]